MPWGEGVRIHFMFHSMEETCCFLDRGTVGSTQPLTPTPQPLTFLPFHLAGRQTQVDSWHPADLMPLSMGWWGTVACQVIFGWVPQHGAFSSLHSVSGLKWQPLYLQNVNWRCHGDRTTLPGSVKIHLSLWVGRGQERNPSRCLGDGGGREEPYSALRSGGDSRGFTC